LLIFDKKNNQSPFNNSFLRNTTCVTGGYTNCDHLFSFRYAQSAYGDYDYYALGLQGQASSNGTTYGTFHEKYGTGIYNCNNSNGCTTSDNYSSSATLGSTAHRMISGTTVLGLFFK